ncbi:hypothetical protein QAD02_012097 [Eretmocerus hayati]|uniref:Uncharacterized protein n=1 Tax=Eretmocerus hayati TaxID=131215 RepID=A0ACC2NYQ2_9HYME|nr:hypothetical protein QAD02_012097 [Eretmocerus hayati]
MEIAVVREFDDLCRLCATKMEILMGFPIFESGDPIKNMEKKITACLPVQISIMDDLPKVICENCALKVDELYDFREKVLYTEKLLKEIFQNVPKEDFQSFDSSMNEIQENLDKFAAEISDMKDSPDSPDNCQSDLTDLQVINGMSMVEQKDIIGDNRISEESNGIEVPAFHLDCNTLRMVNEQMSQVSNEDMSMHLSAGDMTVTVENLTVENHLSQLGIDYVTSLEPDIMIKKQIPSYCNDIQCPTPNPQSLTSSTVANGVNGDPLNIAHSPLQSYILPAMNNCVTVENESIIAQYTQSTKDALLQNALSSPAPDGSQINWYLCPFCNEATVEPGSLATHYEHHFCSCPHCDLYFLSIEALNHHAQECSQVKTIFFSATTNGNSKKQAVPSDQKKSSKSRVKRFSKTCPHCGKEYRTNYKLQEHMRMHTGEKPYKCTMCPKTFRSKIGVAQHVATHTGQFAFTCSTCGKGFQCKSYLVVHQRAHSNVKPYSCDLCSQKFKTKQSLLDHENRHNGVKPFLCDICGRGFVTKGLCKSHKKVHTGVDNRQYPCIVCNKLFVSKSYLNTHMLIHTGEKPYLCEVCGKGFLTRVDLRVHMTMHTGEKSFECNLCGKVFARRSALRCHIRCHTGERPYTCDTCGKTFTQYSPMAIHKRLHTGERPYVCEFCEKRFISRALLASHLRVHRNESSQKSPQDLSFKNLQTEESAIAE